MRRVVLAAAAVAVFASGWAGRASVPASGLKGRVVLSPAGPVCMADDPCTRPAPHVLLAFSQEGKVIARVKTQADGRYKIRLAAGLYRVSAPAYRVGSGVTPKNVRIVKSQVRRVNLTIDSGMQ